MSLGPVSNSNSASSANRAASAAATQSVSQAPAVTSTTATSATAATTARTPASADAQTAARQTALGAEDAVRASISGKAPGTSNADAPKRGLGIEGQEFAGKRSGSGRRTAATGTSKADGPQLASTDNNAHRLESNGLEGQQFAGKRSASGRRTADAGEMIRDITAVRIEQA